MRTLRYTIEIKDGVKVEMLFTPHLYSFKGESGVDFVPAQTKSGVFEVYADVMFCAALSAWVLDGKLVEDFPYKRADFHEWMALNPKDYGKALNFALIALTGKSVAEYLSEGANAKENGKAEAEGSKKKLRLRLNGKK